MPDLTPLTPTAMRNEIAKGLTPDPASAAPGQVLRASDGASVWTAPNVTVVGTADAPVTDPNTPRPDVTETAIWFAAVALNHAAPSDIVIRVDESAVAHSELDGRAEADAHPINAITGLAEAIEPSVRMSTFEAAGDLVVGVGNESIVRFPVGATGHVLTADPQETAGLAWQPLTPDDVAAIQTVAVLERVVIWDNFDRVDGPLGTAPTGHVWTGSNNFGILDRVARRTSGTAYESATIDPGPIVQPPTAESSMLVLEATVDTPDTASNARILLRHIDDANHLFVRVVSNGKTSIVKREGGTETLLAESPAAVSTLGRGIRLRVVLDGTSVVVQNAASSTQIVAHTLTGGDATTFAAQTVVGLAENATHVARSGLWRDFVVRRLR